MYPVIFNNVSCSYGSFYALNDISISFEEKKITAVIGKSGSGKSTLLQSINGLIKPTAGNVKVFGSGINYKHPEELRLKIGYSVQGSSLFPHMTIYNNISLPGKVSNKTEIQIRTRIETLLEFVNLNNTFLKKYPYQLSGGEQQRVGLCRAMLLDPPILLLDEPFAALDSFTKKDIHNELLKIQSVEPRTIIIVTHDLYEAEYLADKIITMDEGKLISG